VDLFFCATAHRQLGKSGKLVIDGVPLRLAGSVQLVPPDEAEPGAIALVAGGLAFSAWRIRRRKSRA